MTNDAAKMVIEAANDAAKMVIDASKMVIEAVEEDGGGGYEAGRKPVNGTVMWQKFRTKSRAK